MYYCMTGRAIQENILDRIGRPKGGTIPRSRTEYFPVLPDLRIAMMRVNCEMQLLIWPEAVYRSLEVSS